jgi:C-terminal processing protease CtpA/Prc
MVVSPGKERRYDGPVLVLTDTGCFSATDIFLSAMKDQPGVTLVGTASGGGSGRARTQVLPASGIGVRISSMASFRAGGALYDGAGIEPDVLVPVLPTDLIGRTDSALQAVRRRIR